MPKPFPARLKTKLEPDYGYMNARGLDPAPDHPYARVFERLARSFSYVV
jgi:hypothetical protein